MYMYINDFLCRNVIGLLQEFLPDDKILKPLPREQILDSSKLKQFADNNSKFYKNGRRWSKRVGNTMRKAEIARYEQFLLFYC